MTRAAAVGRVKRGYVHAAQGAGQLLGRAGLLPTDAPSPQRRWRHWAYSLVRVHDVAGLAALDVPWWTYAAIEEVDLWLASRPGSTRIFEWGAGASTLWLARRAGEVHSVEHDIAFARTLDPAVRATGNTTLYPVPAVASDRPIVGSGKEGWTGFDFKDYVAAIDGIADSFDLIVIDGRARAACLGRALSRVRPDGMIVFDNSRRRRYRNPIATSGLIERRLRGLTPTLPYPEQTSLLAPIRP